MNVAGGCLVVAFTESPNDRAALEFQREVFEEAIRRQTQGVIIDASGVSLMDSLMSKNLVDICRVGLTLGKKTLVVGLKPTVVASLVDLEIDLSSVHTALNIEDAIALISPPVVDVEPLEAKESDLDEEVELEKEDEDEICETEEELSE